MADGSRSYNFPAPQRSRLRPGEMVDLFAGGGHLVECACRATSKSLDPAKALAEWRRINRPPRSARPAPTPEVADSIVQFNLSLAEQPGSRRKAAGGAHGSR